MTRAPSTKLFHKQNNSPGPIPPTKNAAGKQVPTHKQPSLKGGPLRCNACSSLSKTGGNSTSVQGSKVKHVQGKHTWLLTAEHSHSIPELTVCRDWQPLVQHFLNSAHFESCRIWKALNGLAFPTIDRMLLHYFHLNQAI